VEKGAPVAPAKSTPAPSAENRDDDLASERALLERARVAIGRGDATGALEALDRHSARHPAGRLAEEREVLAIQALVSAGRKDEAQARAARFHREHPSSAFGSAVDALVR
jgi:outer membrane protein assembly factor BamD (BamD/ComL family)